VSRSTRAWKTIPTWTSMSNSGRQSWGFRKQAVAA
jgi:hypothetical protein